jgi:hypothetical protein
MSERADGWRAHLVAPYGEERLAGWLSRLRWFRLVRAEPSPFGVEPDRLVVALTTLDEAGRVDARANGARVVDRPGGVLLTVSGGAGRRAVVTDREVELAATVEEQVLVVRSDAVVDPPVEGRGCVWPGAYPDLWPDDPGIA